MINGLRYSSEGMDACMIQQEIIANNLANLSTTGFKSGKVFLRLLEASGSDQRVLQEQEVFDFRQGPMQRTGNSWDLALQGPGFFVVESPQGIRYTRNGSFRLNAEGFLITSGGAYVLGEGGPIQIAGEISVGEKGDLFQNGTLVNRLRIIDFARPYRLHKMADSLFVLPEAIPAIAQPREIIVKQGFLEQSNVDAIREMVAMISVFRHFEADAKALKAQDETLGRAINEMGQVK